MIEEKYRYYAFISYKREDEEWAKWLQHKLEHYKLPSNLNGRTDLPKEIRPVFKDTSELTPGNLPEQISKALEQSKYLIVICSRRSAQSEWVNKEVEAFKSLGKTENIIPFIIDGRPFSSNPEEECFPNAILSLPREQEILGANINEMGRDAAAVKVVARMFDIRFDELWLRHERELRRRRNVFIAAVTAFVLGVLSVAGWIWHQNQMLKEKNYQVLLEQSRFVAATASMLADHGENYMASRLALEVLLNNPYSPEAESALRKAWQGEGTTLSDSIGAGVAIFSPDGKWVAAAMFNNVRLWDSSSGQLLFTLPVGEESVVDIAFNSIGNILQTTDEKGIVKQWKIPEGKLSKSNSVIPNRDYYIAEVFGTNAYFADPLAVSAVYNPDSSMIAVAYRDGFIKIWNVSTRQCVHVIDGKDVAVWACDFFPDGKRLLVAADHYVRIYDLPWHLSYISLNTEIYTPMWKLIFSPDSRHLISASGDMVIRYWNADNGKLVWEKETNGLFESTYTLPKLIEFYDSGATIRIFFDNGGSLTLNSANGQQIGFVRGSVSVEEESELGNTEDFSPDGQTKATIIDNTKVAIYKMGTNEEIWRLHTADPHDVHATVSSIAYSPDNRRIAVGSANGDLRIYGFLPIQELIEKTRERFKGRPLTHEERRKYYLD